MAKRKSDSFFIRASLNIGEASAYQETTIDLGAYVDALGKSVLRIHNIAVTFSDSGGTAMLIDAGEGAGAQFQLCTQSQADTVLPGSSKAIIASGIVYGFNQDGGANFPILSHDMDNLPQLWTNGYLVAVDNIFLGGEASPKWTEDVYVSVVMECTVETMDERSAMALALSQQ